MRLNCVVPGCRGPRHDISRFCVAHTIEADKSWPEWRERYHEPTCVVSGCGEPREGPMSCFCQEDGREARRAWAAAKSRHSR